LGMPSIKLGLELLAERGAWGKFHEFGQRAVRELLENGWTTESQELMAFMKGDSPREIPVDPIPAQPTKRPSLPTHCPACGAGVRPDEVEWLDDVTAECAYCGSPIR
jgi:hypothetical protein